VFDSQFYFHLDRTLLPNRQPQKDYLLMNIPMTHNILHSHNHHYKHPIVLQLLLHKLRNRYMLQVFHTILFQNDRYTHLDIHMAYL
jgi:hypothetical protein